MNQVLNPGLRLTTASAANQGPSRLNERRRRVPPTLLSPAVSMLIFAAVLATERPSMAQTDVRRDASVIAIEEVMPAVVNISTETIVEIRDPVENLFRDFFGPNWGRRPQQSLGSGVIIDDEGYILTNFHVVRRASRITVTLSNNKVYQAKLLKESHKSDVALLKIEPQPGEKLKAVKVAADDDLFLGETVLALGNPFGLGGSVSRGILSSRTRRPPTADEPLELDIADWLQTDAAINPGNSGGPLINLRGELIGLSVAIFRQGQGIGFAIPAKRISEAFSDSFTPEEVRGLWLGARFRSSTNGITATLVETGSPAEKAGLRVGDKLLKLNGKTPTSVIELSLELIAPDAPQDLDLLVQRQTQRRSLVVRLVPEREFFNAGLIRQKVGAVLQEITPEIAAGMGFSRIDGFLVAGVDNNSPAAEAGLQRGYIVQAFNGQVLRTLTDAAKLLHGAQRGERVKLNLLVTKPRSSRLFSATTEVTVR